MTIEKVIERIQDSLGIYDTALENMDLDLPKEVESKLHFVQTENGDSGRWSYCKTDIWQYENDYFAFSCMHPASRLQDGAETNPEVYRVYPHIITTTVYKTKPQN